MIDNQLKKQVLLIQQNEITEFEIYHRLAKIVKNKQQAEILEQISCEELSHYDFWKQFSAIDVPKNNFKIWFYFLIAKIFGLTFGLKLMENGEANAQDVYAGLRELSPEVEKVISDEEAHEYELLGLIDEERLKYASSVVLGLNDALVELTGALVGFTLALQNTRLVGIVGLITGIAASLSMAASEYLSTKQEDTGKNPLKASIYTGIAYVGTVIALILPYLLLKNIYLCLAMVIAVALSVIFIFTYYISVAKGLNFKKRFMEMAGISLGVAVINFAIGLIIRNVFKIEV
ncbi:MAG: VIT1/CCC1 transporter family protein [Candidatus Omnitrophica bacterium]|jgi:VIT1/CCC1 family predicted Fe2+/Mn2+ transporter|nr:VIT1/CCC1 transporter family protein [Candidatus Omnitrophota bacterium]